MFVDLEDPDMLVGFDLHYWRSLYTSSRIDLGLYAGIAPFDARLSHRWSARNDWFEPAIPGKGIIESLDQFRRVYAPAIQRDAGAFIACIDFYNPRLRSGYGPAARWAYAENWPAHCTFKPRCSKLGDELHIGPVTIFKVFKREL
jgi:hypothetical protein